MKAIKKTFFFDLFVFFDQCKPCCLSTNICHCMKNMAADDREYFFTRENDQHVAKCEHYYETKKTGIDLIWPI